MSIALSASSSVFTKADFENWIKLATDNKINASNSWDVALIDYFHDLSVLREGDGINFQKASATLDGCVKIYTSRIDSAATETGRLLSGLATRKNEDVNDQEENEGNDDDDDDDEDENNDDINLLHKKVVKKNKKSSASLVKSFKLLKIKKTNSEIILDPLFKKTLTEFDEGGAKSLLMNLLHIDSSIRVLFDATGATGFSLAKPNIYGRVGNTEQDTHIIELPQAKLKEIDLKSIRNILGPGTGLEKLEICPSMDSLKQIALNDGNPISILEQFQKTESQLDNDNDYDDVGFDDIGGAGCDFNDGSKINGGDSFDISRFYAEDNSKNDGPNMTMVRLFNENFIEESVEASLLGEMDHNIMDYFDNLSSKNWAGPEHWKVRNLRLALDNNQLLEKSLNSFGSHKLEGTNTHKRAKKDTTIINFFAKDVELDDENLFKSGKNITQPKSRWKNPTFNLLPEDQMFTTKNFIYLSLKPNKLINTVLFGRKSHLKSDYNASHDGTTHSQTTTGDNFGDLHYRNKLLDDLINGDLQEIHDSFGNAANDWNLTDHGGNFDDYEDEIVGGGAKSDNYGSQLVRSLSSFKPTNINFARVAKRVDVKLLKDNLWDSFKEVKLLLTTLKDSQDDDKMHGEDDDNRATTGSDQSLPKTTLDENSNNAFKFKEIVQQTGKKYPKKQRDDLSTSFCFICLLHLANENGLNIESNEDFSDLIIRE